MAQLREIAEERRRRRTAAGTAPSPVHVSCGNGTASAVQGHRDARRLESGGQPVKSLSAITAREMRGTHWNGPAFFGLRKQEEAA